MLNGLKSRLHTIAASKVVQEVGITYSGQILGSGIGFLIQLFLQREMGPADYGILGLATSIGSLTGVLTDLGISHAMVRFGSKYLAEAPKKAMSRFATALLTRTLLTLVVMAVGYLTASWLATDLFGKPELLRPLRWMYLTSMGPVLFAFWTFFIQTFQKFLTRSGVVVATALTRVVLIGSCFLFFNLSPSSVIVADALASLIGFLIGMAFSPRGLFHVERSDMREAAGELLPYCRFTGILIVGDIIFNELDTFMLGTMADAETVGLYRAAWTYAAVVGFLNQSVANVLFPKVTAISDTRALAAYIKRMLLLSLGLSLALLPFVPLVAWWIPFFQPEYSAATSIFYIMFVGLIVDLVIGPIGYVLYSLERPGILSSVAVFKIAVNFAANLSLIPIYGANGAATATVLTRILGGIVTVWVISRTLKRRNRAS